MHREIAAAPGEPRSLADRVSWAIVCATTVLIPLLLSRSGKDAFRLPKQLLFETSALLLIAVAACAAILQIHLTWRRWPRPVAWTIGGILVWSTITTIFSTNRTLSSLSLVTVAAATVLFTATYNGIDRRRPIGVIYLILVPAAINAVVAILQRTQIWSPFATNVEFSARLRTTAFLGNPNDIGWSMVAPLLAAVALAGVSRRHRIPALLFVALLAAAAVASETVGAIGAAAAGCLVFIARQRRWPAALAFAAVLIVIPLAAVVSSERRAAVRDKVETALQGDFDVLLSGRMPAYVTSWRMFAQNPLLGVGLGCYGFNYFDQKLALADRYPFMARHPENWGEAHNEHLQVLAEGGLPYYALFLGAMVLLARVTFLRKTTEGDERQMFARALALPLVVAVFVLALTAFPLRIAVTLQQLVFTSALLIGWGLDE